MPEEISYDAITRLIRIRVWGDDPFDDWVESKRQVVDLYESHGATMLLVDVREQLSAPGPLDVFDFGEDWPAPIRLAILIGEDTPEDVLFLETVAANRGKSILVFYEESAALKWLQE